MNIFKTVVYRQFACRYMKVNSYYGNDIMQGIFSIAHATNSISSFNVDWPDL